MLEWFLDLSIIAVPIFAGLVTTYALLFDDGCPMIIAFGHGMLVVGLGFVLTGILPVHTMPSLLIVVLVASFGLSQLVVAVFVSMVTWINRKRAVRMLRRKGFLL